MSRVVRTFSLGAIRTFSHTHHAYRADGVSLSWNAISPRVPTAKEGRASSLPILAPALAFAAGFLSASAEQQNSGHTEKHTGVKFDHSLQLSPKFPALCYSGSGVRIRLKFFKVYAVAFYVEPKPLRAIFENDPPEDPVEATIQAKDVDKAFKLVFTRDVDNATFWEAMKTSIQPRLPDTPDAASQLMDFQKCFKEGSGLKTGSELVFYFDEKKGLLLVVLGDQCFELKAPLISSALLDIYLGKEPVSQDARDDFIRGLLEVGYGRRTC